jgi:hypothetical protein
MKTKYSKYVEWEEEELDSEFVAECGCLLSFFGGLFAFFLGFLSDVTAAVAAIFTLPIFCWLIRLGGSFWPFVSYPFKCLYVIICIEKEIKSFKQSVKQGKKHDEERYSKTQKAAYEILVDDNNTSQFLLAEIAKKKHSAYDKDIMSTVLEKAISRLSEQTLLANVAKVAQMDKIRMIAIEKLITENHQPLLAEIAKEDTNSDVRMAAINLIAKNNQSLFAEIAKEGQYYDGRTAAIKKLIPENHQPLLAEIAKEDTDFWHREVRIAAMEKLIPENHQPLLAEIAKEDKNWEVRSAAYKKINDEQRALWEIVKNAPISQKIESLKSLTEQALLADIAKEYENRKVCRAAIEKLTDENLILSVIAFYGNNLKEDYVDILKFIYNTHKKDIIQDAVRKYNGKEYNYKELRQVRSDTPFVHWNGVTEYDEYQVEETVTEKFYVS